MLSVSFPFEELTRISQKTREKMVQDRPALMERLGGILGAKVLESFSRRATGQPDVGITWQPLTEGYLRRKRRRGLSDKIGIATGRLVESLEVDEEGNRIHTGFASGSAFAFNRLRRLLPEIMPDEWVQPLEEAAVEWADEILVTHLEDEVSF